MSPFTSSAAKILICFSSPQFFTGPEACAPGSDRPIGLTGCGSVDLSVSGFWCDMAIVVTREAIEKALSLPYQTGNLAKGVLDIGLVDNGSDWNGNYDLYFRVERVP